MIKAARTWARNLRRRTLHGQFGRTVVAIVVAYLIVNGLLPPGTDFDLASATYWNVWAITYLGLTWFLILRSSSEQTRRWALEQHPFRRSWLPRVLQMRPLTGRTSGLLFVVVISLVGLLSAISLLPEVRDLQSTQGVLAAVLNLIAVVTAWAVLHTSYALYYASRYYSATKRPGGLVFPGSQNPNQLDFAYFAFTLGTSFAVSDVEVTASNMRRSVLAHQVLSFFYNTAILALAINLAVDL